MTPLVSVEERTGEGRYQYELRRIRERDLAHQRRRIELIGLAREEFESRPGCGRGEECGCNRWNILLPGPSLAGTTLGDDRNFPTIAVNAALLHPEGADVFVAVDRPECHEEDTIRKIREEHLVVVSIQKKWLCVPGMNALVILKWWNGEHPRPAGAQAYARAQAVRPPWSHQNSMGLAVYWAALNGATDIRLYGCDLDGEGYFDRTIEDRKGRDAQEWRQRWNEERLQLATLVRAGREVGIQVRRVKPEGETYSWFFDLNEPRRQAARSACG